MEAMIIIMDLPTMVFVKMLKSFKEMLIPFKPMSMHCCSNKLNVINCSISIHIGLKCQTIYRSETEIKQNHI